MMLLYLEWGFLFVPIDKENLLLKMSLSTNYQ